MKISRIEIGEIQIPLAVPFKTALRSVTMVDDIIIKVIADDGTIGYGEAPPTGVITGDTKGSVICAIKEFIGPSILGMDIENLDGIMTKIHSSILKNTSAKAAVDMAIYDLYAKNLQRPLYKILGGHSNLVETDLTISINSIDEMIKDSLAAVEKGFRILKIKVGKEGTKDIERISAIRQAVGKDIILRVDANQGWTVKDAIKIIREMEDRDLNIELIEQPVSGYDFEGMKMITSHVNTKILADESVFSPEDAIKIIRERAADYINIKLMKTGGIYEALKICNIAEIYHVECMIGCMLESKIAVSAAAHLAAGKGIITKADLDGPSLCKVDPYIGGPVFEGANITMNTEYGLGITEVPAHFYEFV